MNTFISLRKKIFLALSLPAALCGVVVLISASAPKMWADDNRGEAADQGARHVLYVESNDSAPGKNAVIAYSISPEDGSLSFLGTFPTRGAGQSNFDVRLGPDDHDREVI